LLKRFLPRSQLTLSEQAKSGRSALRFAMVVPWSYHSVMSSVVKRSISLPADVFEALESQAAEEGRTVSAALAEAADLWLATRRGLRAVRAWERQHGALTAEELAAADLELDRAGVGRH
jgi:CopG-like RHH_1 or ribbon-helix-helix domain, RHH_5